MFGFLKKKLKKVVDKFSNKVEEEIKEEIEEKEIKEKKEIKPEVKEGKIKEKVIEKKGEVKEKQKEEKIEEEKEEEPEKKKAEPEKKGFAKKITEKITKTTISEKKFDELFWDLEVALMENNVAVEVIEKIKQDLKKQLTSRPLARSKIQETIIQSLKDSIEELFYVKKRNLIQEINEKKEKPYVILFVGINGSGKTTTIAKTAKLLKDNNLKCVLAASDTFRAAAIQQLEKHAEALKVKLIKHDYGADPAAVAFDAIKYAEAKNIDAVLIDTAGRLHTNINLVDEMKKIARVAKPDMKIFVGESITGNDCVEQAKRFNEAIGIDGMILAKADIDEKGGAAISVSYVTQKPIMFIGTGQSYTDLAPFNPEIIVDSLGLA